MNKRSVVRLLKEEFITATGKSAIIKVINGEITFFMTNLWLATVSDYKAFLRILHDLIIEYPDLAYLITEELIIEKAPVNIEQDAEACWFHGYLSRVCEENNDEISLLMDFELDNELDVEEDDGDGDEEKDDAEA